jgi:hypothetical protein
MAAAEDTVEEEEDTKVATAVGLIISITDPCSHDFSQSNRGTREVDTVEDISRGDMAVVDTAVAADTEVSPSLPSCP